MTITTIRTPSLRHVHDRSYANGTELLVINGYTMKLKALNVEPVKDYVEHRGGGVPVRTRIGDLKERVIVTATVRNCDDILGKLIHESNQDCGIVSFEAHCLEGERKGFIELDSWDAIKGCDCCEIPITLTETEGVDKLLPSNYAVDLDDDTCLTTLSGVPIIINPTDSGGSASNNFLAPVSDLFINDCAISTGNVQVTWTPNSQADYYEISISDSGGVPTIVTTNLPNTTFSYAIPATTPYIGNTNPIDVTVFVTAYAEIDGQLVSSTAASVGCTNIDYPPEPPTNLSCLVDNPQTTTVNGIPFTTYDATLSWISAVQTQVTNQPCGYEYMFGTSPRGFWAANLADDFDPNDVPISLSASQTSVLETFTCVGDLAPKFRIRTVDCDGDRGAWVAVACTECVDL